MRRTEIYRREKDLPGLWRAKMKTSRLFLMSILAVWTINSSIQAAEINGPNQWTHDYGAARRLSKKLGLPVIVHFHASWCGPCQQMERETLGSRQLRSHMGTSFIGVKIDSDQEPGLVEAFRIQSLPSDIVIAPGGRIVDRSAGYQTRGQYIATVQKWQKKLSKERQLAIALLQPAKPPTIGQRQPMPLQPAPRKQIVGLDGYSPVQIKNSRRWIKGDPRYAATHDGIVYHLSSEAELRTFIAAPHRYSPRMLGCDPVELWKTDRAFAGSVEYGAFFENELFLFRSAASRREFKLDPSRFVRMRHVLRADDIQGATRFR
jgi:thiol-disulfide isomerase/thioredoxin/YHS domain-containing protein